MVTKNISSSIKYLKLKKIIINKIEFCPYHPEGIIKKYRKKTNLRKPGNLMIKKIFKKWKIDKKRSFMIGDKITDKKAAIKSNLYFEYAKNNFYKQIIKLEKKIVNNYL